MRNTTRIFAGLLWLVCTSARAEPKITVAEEFYDISGATLADLRAMMLKEGPKTTKGKRFNAMTRWTLRWEAEYKTVEGTCRFDGLVVSLGITYHLPRLQYGGAQMVAFERFYNALRTHELGHGDISREGAGVLEREMLQLPPQVECAALTQEAKQLYTTRRAAIRLLHAAYDKDSDHGRTQGARLEE